MASGLKKGKRTELTTAEKVDLIDHYRKLNAKSLREGAELLGVSVSFLHQTLKKEKEIRASAKEGTIHRIRERAGKDKLTEDALKRWLESLQARHAPVLCQKAEQIAAELGHSDFKATEGWFHRWKKRNGLVFTK